MGGINSLETDIVEKVISGLHRNGVSKENIVVMTPYTDQKQAIIRRLKVTEKEGACNVKTVHEMQGSESKFVIFNTVRTTNVGFLDDPHLMCVCLSRQKVYLVVVGNAKLLRCIPIWSTFFEFISDQANAQIVTPQWLEYFKA